MGYFVGYVSHFKGKEKAANGAWVAKTIFCNHENTKIQVVAWGDRLIKELKQFSQLNWVVEIDGVLIRDLNGLWKYNDGNISFELRIGDHTKMTKLGIYESPKEVQEPTLMSMKNLTIFGGFVKITGFILNPFRLLDAKDKHYGLGSIVADGCKLEVKINSFSDKKDHNNPFDSGVQVEIMGVLKRRNIPKTTTPCPAYFEVENEMCIKILPSKIKTDVDYFLSIYAYIK